MNLEKQLKEFYEFRINNAPKKDILKSISRIRKSVEKDRHTATIYASILKFMDYYEKKLK